MINHDSILDRMFQALADGHRLRMIERLSLGPLSVSDLAAPLGISLPAVMQHIGVLEASGLLKSEKHGRVRTCRLVPEALSLAESWISRRRAMVEGQLDRLNQFLEAEREEEK